MTTSFAPALSDLAIDIFERLDIRLPAVTAEQYASLTRSMNLIQSQWSNTKATPWKLELGVTQFVSGQATYILNANVMDVVAVYVQQNFAGRVEQSTIENVGNNASVTVVPATDPVPVRTKLLEQITVVEYAAIPNQTLAAPPEKVWYNRVVPPTLNLWPVPDSNGILFYYYLQQMNDAFATGTNAPDMPYYMLEKFSADVAAHMSLKWAPQMSQSLIAYAQALVPHPPGGGDAH